MPLSHLGITLPGLYDKSPIFSNSPSGHTLLSSTPTQPHNTSAGYNDRAVTTGCAGNCVALGRRCYQCQGGALSQPSGQPSSGYSGGGSLYSAARIPVPTTASGAHQEPDSTLFASPALYTASPTGQPAYPSLNAGRGQSASVASFAGADPRGQYTSGSSGSSSSSSRGPHQQQSMMIRVPSLSMYEGAQPRPPIPSGQVSAIPSMQAWTQKEQGQAAQSSGIMATTNYPQGASPTAMFQPWPSVAAPSQPSMASGGSTDSSLRPSSSSSSSASSQHHYHHHHHHQQQQQQQQQANPRYLNHPSAASSGPPAFQRSVSAGGNFVVPFGSTSDYYTSNKEPLYQHQLHQHYVNPSQYNGQATSSDVGSSGSMSMPGNSFQGMNGGPATSNGPSGVGYQAWASMGGFNPSSASAAASDQRQMLATSVNDNAMDLNTTPFRRHSAFDDDDSRWEGVANRSHLADRYYLYGASTTRIYCRPSCASKRPTRDRVQFFPQPNAAAAAEAAGFRSCRRCKPGRMGGGDQTANAVGECVRHMMMAAATSAEEGGEPKKKTLKEYAARAGLSTFHFHRSLAKVMSITPGEFSKACQSLALQDALGMDSAPPGVARISARVYDAALAGWSSRRAKRALGNVDPSAYASGDALHNPIIRTSVRGTEWGNVSMVYTAPSTTGVMTLSGTVGGGGSSGFISPSHHQQGHHAHAPPPHHHYAADRTSLSPTSGGHGQGQSTNGDRVLLALLISPDAEQRLARRFPSAVPGDAIAQEEVHELVSALVRSGIREEQLPTETVPSIRRARLWAASRLRLTASSGGGNGNGSVSAGGAGGAVGTRFSTSDASVGQSRSADVREEELEPVPLDRP